MFCRKPTKPIVIFKGDDTNFDNNRKLFFEIESLDALNPTKIEFSFLGVKRVFDTIPTDGRFEVSFSHEDTAKFPLGTSFATLTAIDSDDRERTLDNRIAILVTNNVALAYCGDDDKLISIKIGTIDSNIVPPNAEAQTGEAADAKAVYDALEKKCDKPTTSTVAIGTNAFTGDAEGSGIGAIAIGENAKSPITGSIAIGQNAETTGPFPFASCLVAIGADAKATPNEPIVIGSDSTAITAKAKVVVTKDGVMTIGGKEVAMAEKIPTAPDLSGYAKTAEVLPRYRFVGAAIVDGVVTVAPYTNAKIVSDGTAFAVEVGEGSGYARDCVLRVECGETAPNITWGTNFHPRTDAETDFKCEAGVRNIYWITEHAPGEFCVAGWQETTGGNAQ